MSAIVVGDAMTTVETVQEPNTADATQDMSIL